MSAVPGIAAEPPERSRDREGAVDIGVPVSPGATAAMKLRMAAI
jgi:hypothetical protein